MIVKVVKSYQNTELWSVIIIQGNQSFRLDYHARKEEAKWMAKMFRKAIKAHNEALLSS